MHLTRLTALFTFVSLAFAAPTVKAPTEVVRRVETADIHARSVVTLGKRFDFKDLGLEKRGNGVSSVGGFVNSLLPLLGGVPLVGPRLDTLLGLLRTNIRLSDLRSGKKTVQDLAKESHLPADDLIELFSHLPFGTIPNLPKASLKKREDTDVPLLGFLLPMLGGVPSLGPLLTTLVGLSGTTISQADLQSGAKTIRDLSDETGLPVRNIKALFSHLPPRRIPGL